MTTKQLYRKLMEDRYEALKRDLGHALAEMGRDMDRVEEALKSSGKDLRDTTVEEYAATFAPSLSAVEHVRSLKVQVRTYRQFMREFESMDVLD